MKPQHGHRGVFLNVKDIVGCRMVVGGKNSSGSKPQNRKAGVHREHSSFSNVSVTGMETTGILHQLVPPTRLPETYMVSHQRLLNTQAKTTCMSSLFRNADIVLVLQGQSKHQDTGRQWRFLWWKSLGPGSWGPAKILAHICWSHQQHHHRSFLQHTHFSFPVTLPKTPIFCNKASGVSGEYTLALLATTATGFCIRQNHVMVPKCQISRVQPHQQMGVNANADQLCPPSAPQGQGSSRLGGRCFILHLLKDLVPTGIRHLMHVHRLPLCSLQTWCSNFFVFLAHWKAVTWKAQDIELLLQVASAAAPGEIWSNTIRINTFYIFFLTG